LNKKVGIIRKLMILN